MFCILLERNGSIVVVFQPHHSKSFALWLISEWNLGIFTVQWNKHLLSAYSMPSIVLIWDRNKKESLCPPGVYSLMGRRQHSIKEHWKAWSRKGNTWWEHDGRSGRSTTDRRLLNSLNMKSLGRNFLLSLVVTKTEDIEGTISWWWYFLGMGW